jgi:hypothetical protein
VLFGVAPVSGSTTIFGALPQFVFALDASASAPWSSVAMGARSNHGRIGLNQAFVRGNYDPVKLIQKNGKRVAARSNFVREKLVIA